MGESTRALEVRAEVPTRSNDATSRYRFLSPHHRPANRLLPEDHCFTPRAILPLSSRADSPVPLSGASSLSQCQVGERWGTTRGQSGRAPGGRPYRGNIGAHLDSPLSGVSVCISIRKNAHASTIKADNLLDGREVPDGAGVLHQNREQEG